MPPPSILWLRRDLRRGDLPALGAAHDAARDGDEQGEVAVVFVLDPALWRGAGDARRAWLAESIKAADAAYDGRLCVREGDPVTVLPQLAAEARRRFGARLPRDHPSGSPPRPQGRCRTGRGGCPLGRDRFPVCRGAGFDEQRRGRALQGLHAVLPRVARARLAGAGHRAQGTAARAACAPTSRRCSTLKEAREAADLPEPARGRRGGCAATVGGLPRRRPGRLRHRPRPRGPRRRLAALALPQDRGRPPTHPARRPGGRPPPPRRRGRAVRDRAGLARVLRRRPVAPPPLGLARPADSPGRDGLRRGRGRGRGLAAGAHRLPRRGRGHAPAAPRGLDAQPDADGHGQLPHQGPARLVAARRPALPTRTSSTATSPPTTTAGSGWPEPAPTHPPTSGCSTR